MRWRGGSGRWPEWVCRKQAVLLSVVLSARTVSALPDRDLFASFRIRAALPYSAPRSLPTDSRANDKFTTVPRSDGVAVDARRGEGPAGRPNEFHGQTGIYRLRVEAVPAAFPRHSLDRPCPTTVLAGAAVQAGAAH